MEDMVALVPAVWWPGSSCPEPPEAQARMEASLASLTGSISQVGRIIGLQRSMSIAATGDNDSASQGWEGGEGVLVRCHQSPARMELEQDQ